MWNKVLPNIHVPTINYYLNYNEYMSLKTFTFSIIERISFNLLSKFQRIQTEQPAMIFSGHFHQSFHFSGEKARGHASHFYPFVEPRGVLNFSLFSENVHEIIVPTCNYRMGRQHYGFGLAVIGPYILFLVCQT